MTRTCTSCGREVNSANWQYSAKVCKPCYTRMYREQHNGGTRKMTNEIYLDGETKPETFTIKVRKEGEKYQKITVKTFRIKSGKAMLEAIISSLKTKPAYTTSARGCFGPMSEEHKAKIRVGVLKQIAAQKTKPKANTTHCKIGKAEEAFILQHKDDMKYIDIAKKIGVSPATVSYHMKKLKV